eukprot:2529175-Amphidinium_carterae.1
MLSAKALGFELVGWARAPSPIRRFGSGPINGPIRCCPKLSMPCRLQEQLEAMFFSRALAELIVMRGLPSASAHPGPRSH